MLRRRLTRSADSWKRLDSPREARRPQLLNWSASDWFEAGLKKARAPEPCGSFARSDVGGLAPPNPLACIPSICPRLWISVKKSALAATIDALLDGRR